MNIKQIEKLLIDGGIEPNEAKIEARLLVKKVLGLTEKDLILSPEFDDNAGREVVLKAQLRASKRLPIQYILGEADFMGEKFIVNESVLIPRDETELLVRKAVKIINEKQNRTSPFTLDIGTGSGCIACMIAKLTDSQVLGVDISTDALQVALDNTSKLGLFNKAIFRKSDVFSKIRDTEKFDLIISNPPYIPIKEKENLQTEVKFEPENALFAHDKEGIDFYAKIISEAGKFLNPEGYLLFELGIGQAELVKRLMEKAGFNNIEIEKDFAGIERVISAQYKL